MSVCSFRSSFASHLQAFLELRRAAGREGKSDQKILGYIDQFLRSEVTQDGPISRQVVERWVKQMQHLSSGTRVNRISVLRQFCAYLSHFDSRTCIIGRAYLARRLRFRPHIYSRREVKSMMVEARKQGSPDSFKPQVLSTLIGLLYATGLRIGEALKLSLGDVDLDHRVLLVRDTKFKKTRYVPISTSVCRHIKRYLNKRKSAGFSVTQAAPFFVNAQGRRYGSSTMSAAFLVAARKIGLRGPKGKPGPRIHDFRHTFAVNRLATWYKNGATVSAKLPLLATYLGHSSLVGTETYLQATAELLQKASGRFRSQFLVPETRTAKGCPNG